MLPENLTALHQHEEQTRAEIVKLIEASEHLGGQVAMAHDALDIITVLVRDHVHRNDDELTLQLLGIRLLNTAAAALKLALSGYYQAALHLTRDLLETANLLSLFRIDRSKLTAWKTADEKALRKEFSPVVVRRALEAAPLFVGQRRDIPYKRFSEYAAHPTYKGLQLTTSDGIGNIGSFVDLKWLKASLEELAMHAAHGGMVLSTLYDNVSPGLRVAMHNYMSRLEAYRHKYLTANPAGAAPAGDK